MWQRPREGPGERRLLSVAVSQASRPASDTPVREVTQPPPPAMGRQQYPHEAGPVEARSLPALPPTPSASLSLWSRVRDTRQPHEKGTHCRQPKLAPKIMEIRARSHPSLPSAERKGDMHTVEAGRAEGHRLPSTVPAAASGGGQAAPCPAPSGARGAQASHPCHLQQACWASYSWPADPTPRRLLPAKPRGSASRLTPHRVP